jgi:hypothetical protein
MSKQLEIKLATLRETINRSVERGGSYTDEEVAAYIERLHARVEQESHRGAHPAFGRRPK